MGARRTWFRRIFLADKFWTSSIFENLSYKDGRYVISITSEEDQGIWQSVNDFRVQVGREILERFLVFVDAKTSTLAFINTPYLTMAWTVRRKDE